MLARRRRRKQERNKQKSIENAAREVVEKELDCWRGRVLEAKKETETRRRHYQHQEHELRRLYEKSCQQLEQRRDTLLATTSLIPYTQTIQAASNFRVPAALLTLQARLCLHVHCLCVHEELLLKTKEQGWDTIAWMEDVSRQLRMLTQKQILLLQVKMQEKFTLLKQMNIEVEFPEIMQQNPMDGNVQAAAAAGEGVTEGSVGEIVAASTSSSLTSAAGSSSLQHRHHPLQQPSRSKDESFLEFLQRYEERKAHQEKADQMRLAEFRSRGNSPPPPPSTTPSENPYTTRRAGVGKKLKNYASKWFQGGGSGSGNHGSAVTFGGGSMDESLHLDDLNSMAMSIDSPSHANSNNNDNALPSSAVNEESANSLASISSTTTTTTSGRQSWNPFVRPHQLQQQQRSTTGSTTAALSQSESQLDTGWSLGNSLRGFRKRGAKKSLDDDIMDNIAGAQTTATAATTTTPEGSEEEEIESNGTNRSSVIINNSGQQQQQQQQNDKNHDLQEVSIDEREVCGHKDHPKDSGVNNVDANIFHGGEDEDGLVDVSTLVSSDHDIIIPTTDSNNNTETGRDRRRSNATPSTSPLKNKLKAPVMHKFFESARW